MTTRAKAEERSVTGLDDRGGSPLRARTAYRLIKVGELMMRIAETALAPLGIRPRHFNVLATLAADATLSQQEVSRTLGIDPNVMVGLIDDLEKLGLARRERNPEDRRRHVIVLTDAGQDLLREGYRRVAKAEAQIFAPLSEAERATLDSATETLLGGYEGQPLC
ncbi:MarR family winged helix-turn-helix transcriptional regulator [Allostreptomyces psammosilenae]|uniref:DNA-binding MarR family transcriptional regulator n=1 Tax=Allostreptomyces psammosilenae TaxID=1892865 RepID=A0A852ZU12_9ACTN|nr:MarR family transcriptional regulator [Allostreptomyces psammosilenae]NYI05365.1 DNA-binding MarR family transcriptional regulator [Allostreptomyces psammosilenae]